MVKCLITGGNGFLGRGIIRRARKENWDWDITTLSRDESKQIRVNSMFPGVRTVKGDVSDDIDYLSRLLAGFDIVIHAGANKLVDVGERSAFEVVKNNIVGSEHLARAAIKAGVKQVIGISSDKAVQPVNTYGMSKAVMERIFQEADTLSDTEFTCARYGNVVGSTISIFTYFDQQMKELGYIKLTVPEMTRFYMSVDEAIDAILFSQLVAKRASVVIPRMQSMSVGDAARLFLNMSPDCPIDNDERIKIVGPRPGEKLHESLLHEQESVRITGPRGDIGINMDGSLTEGSKLYWELRPSIEGAQRDIAFSITSDKAPLGPMPFDRMRELVEDAKTV